jgi:hypothetical protein|nr:MAG TPA: hypothetical protein [Bacteriophage sp.]
MTPINFFEIYFRESREFVISVLEKHDVLTLQRIKKQCKPGWLRCHVIDAINHKLSGM